MQTMAIDLVNSRPPRLECSCKPLREWMGAVLIGRFLARYWRKHFFPPLSDSLSLSLSRCETEREKLLNPNISEFWCSFHKLEGNRVKRRWHPFFGRKFPRDGEKLSASRILFPGNWNAKWSTVEISGASSGNSSTIMISLVRDVSNLPRRFQTRRE